MRLRREIGSVRSWGIGRRIATGAGLIAAIGVVATAISDIQILGPTVHWVRHHGIVTLSLVAALLLLDDLRRLFSRQGSLAAHRLNRTADERRVKYIAFISASSGDESFYALIFNHLVQCSRAMSDTEMRLLLIPWFPKQSFDIGKELRDDVRALQAVNNFQFAGIFVIPDDPDTDLDDLRLLREVSENIVFLDVTFDPADKVNEWVPCFVGGDELRGSTLAAEIAVEYFKEAGADSPHVLVIKGRSTKWESQRFENFRNVLVDALPSVVVKFADDEAMYSRIKARDLVYRQLREDARRSALPNLIFACNDDMALGAHDAIRRLIREGAFSDSSAPLILGYDGIQEMTDLIDSGDELILGTVYVSINKLATHAMENMKRMIQGRPSVDRSPEMKAIRGFGYRKSETGGGTSRPGRPSE